MTSSEEHHTLGKTDALLILMATIWAVNFSVIKYAVQVLSPLAFTGIRVAIAAMTIKDGPQRTTFGIGRGNVRLRRQT